MSHNPVYSRLIPHLSGMRVMASLFLLGVVVGAISLTPLEPQSRSLADARSPPLGFPDARLIFPLGTDAMGRDMATMLASAGRTSLLIALGSSLIAAVVGTSLGLLASSAGRTIDRLIVRLTEFQLTFPAIFVALILHAMLGMSDEPAASRITGSLLVTLAIAAAAWPEHALLSRAAARREWRLEHIEAARAIGASELSIVRRNIWPSVRPHTITLMVWTASRAVGIEATLSYLGVGLPVGVPSLGRMIRDGQSGLLSGEWWLAGLPILVAVVLCSTLAVVAEHLRARMRPEI
jgi:peptide/nickel transport system permease protein